MSDSLSEELTELLADLAKEYAPAPWGGLSSVLINRYGKKPIQYFIPGEESATEQDGQTPDVQPDFAVIGMGRCGSHVAVALHKMVTSEASKQITGQADKSNASKAISSWVRKLSRSNGEQPLEFKPVMLVGDTDETTFKDVQGLTVDNETGTSEEDAEQDATDFLKLSYEPLADRGVGHNPSISQFLTRALLVAPDNLSIKTELGWQNAKRFLLSVENIGDGSGKKSPPRLAFYVFSSGGGTGCGAAAEILKAQQFATVKATGNSLTYYCAVAVLPEASEVETKRHLNTGRFIIQYLADQFIKLSDPDDYTKVPVYRGASGIAPIQTQDGATSVDRNRYAPVPTSSWNSVLFVSNEIMNPVAEDRSIDKAIELSNQYIAQQLFNLAGPQISASTLTPEDSTLSSKNFEAIRLDSMDLRGSLRGPCACCFAAAAAKEVQRGSGEPLDWVRNLVRRAISIPTMREEVGLIEGISVCPDLEDDYGELMKSSSIDELATDLSKLDFFSKAASIVFSITAPQKEDVLQVEIDEIIRILGLLFPNLHEVRYSVIYGTTEHFTISVYVEGSVVFAPEVFDAVYDYVNFCWPKARKMSDEEFSNWWDETLARNPPLSGSDIHDALGAEEDLVPDYPNLKTFEKTALGSWHKLLENVDEPDQSKFLSEHVSFDDLSVTSAELASALSFYNYFSNRRKRERASAARRRRSTEKTDLQTSNSKK
ncbi:hypothetical protein [Gymnodinialimonas sp.]